MKSWALWKLFRSNEKQKFLPEGERKIYPVLIVTRYGVSVNGSVLRKFFWTEVTQSRLESSLKQFTLLKYEIICLEIFWSWPVEIWSRPFQNWSWSDQNYLNQFKFDLDHFKIDLDLIKFEQFKTDLDQFRIEKLFSQKSSKRFHFLHCLHF